MPEHLLRYIEQIKQLTEMDCKVLFENDHEALKEHAEQLGIAAKDVKHYWHKSKSFSLFVKNSGKTYAQIFDALKEEMLQAAPIYPKIKRNLPEQGHLLIIDPADIHIGKLASEIESGDSYTVDKAVNRIKEGVQGILDKTASFNIDQILYVGGNDILHIDTPKRTTTSGTPQDTDGSWHENYIVAKQVIISVLEQLLTVADVHFVFNPSNHDYTNGFFLADVIQTWFAKNENITFDCSIAHRKYYTYGTNLIGTTHGDGAKETDLPLLMAEEAPKKWAETKHRYIYTHHVHHKKAKDYGRVSVEAMRSASGTDSWHHRKGYRSIKAIEGFLHDKTHGQIARISHIF